MLAALALFVSLTGTGTAARHLLTGRDIQDRSIGSVDIALQAQAAMVKRFGGTSARSIHGKPVILIPGAVKTVYAVCPPRTRATGGGYFAGDAAILATAATSRGTRWYVIAYNSTTKPVEVRAYAVCAHR
ncbi:MAG: hypothetical protein M3540_05580 [Actinomycetota bacterium]|nr:hypothetical protein [Actinomycetota bacterium]